jgi:hypothetical protein
MQPYFFPYIGYFQLINAVDKFVLLDDVNFINRGWINRNRILVNNKEYLFSVPIKKVSQNKLIIECELSDELWQKKFLKTVEMNYKKASFFEQTYQLITDIVNFEERNLSRFIYNHINKIFDYLNIKINIAPTSSIYQTYGLKAQEKIIEICKKEKATQYINPIGGMDLYENKRFLEENIQLGFLKTNEINYSQFNSNFIPWLSIIDVMMFNSKQVVIDFLTQYNLVTNV